MVIANAVLLAGHVEVGDRAILGGGAAFHQFVRVGENAIVGGLARITLDIPPFVLAAERDEIAGLNLVGLRRRGLARENVRQLKEAFRAVYSKKGNVRDFAAKALATGAFPAPEARASSSFSRAASGASPAPGGSPRRIRTRRPEDATVSTGDPAPLALTCGDPAGIGPEVLAAWLASHPEEAAAAAVIGPARWLESLPSAARKIAVGLEEFAAEAGRPNGEGALVAWAALERAAAGCRSGEFAGVVTGPVAKGEMARIGWEYPGQTEFFAARWGGEPTMAFCGGRLRIVLLTWHIPLREVPAQLTAANFARTVRAAEVLVRAEDGAGASGGPVRIGVCGLNPHAGEGGCSAPRSGRSSTPCWTPSRPTVSRSLPGPGGGHGLWPAAAGGV